MIEIKEIESLVEFRDLHNLDIFEVGGEMFFKIPKITITDCSYPPRGGVIVRGVHEYNALKIEGCELLINYKTFKPTDLVKKLDAKLEIKR